MLEIYIIFDGLNSIEICKFDIVKKKSHNIAALEPLKE
jgi:hypothetical protein